MNGPVLITGGLGYVGGRIARTVGTEVWREVRLGVRDAGGILPPALDGCTRTVLDLEDDASLDAACIGIESVVHLAALNEIDSAADPERALRINGVGSLKLLRAAERAGVKRFIYFSTAHVYGAPLCGVISETTLPRPIHPYAITHRTAEDFVLAAHDRRVLTGIVVRLSNGFGAPLTANVNRWTLVVNDLCRQAVETGSLRLLSTGLQRRDFITLGDTGRAVAHLLALDPTTCGDGVFNLGGENPFRIIDVAERVADRCVATLGFRPPIIRPEPREGERSEPLEYRIDRLRDSGFTLENDVDGEIDATLFLCRDAFGEK